MTIFTSLVMYAFAIGAIALTISHSSLFQGVRNAFVDMKWNFVAQLVHCPFCLSPWLAYIFLTIRPIDPNQTIYDTLFYSFVLMGMSSLISGNIFRAFASEVIVDEDQPAPTDPYYDVFKG